MLSWTSRGLKIAETWFDEPVPAAGLVDIVRYRQALQPLSEGADDFYTLIIDLTQPEAALFDRIHKDGRYQIRRAEDKDGFGMEVWDRREDGFLDAFLAFYDGFAALKGLPSLDRNHLKLLQREGRLDLTRVMHEGQAIVYHAHYVHGGRARLLHSASQFRGSEDPAFRTLVGRANRWLHWKDMVRLKAEGTGCFDWGGWYEGQEDKARLNINQFKETFGGEVQRTYNGELLLTLKAKVMARVARLLGRR
jgi:hypothetical protein